MYEINMKGIKQQQNNNYLMLIIGVITFIIIIVAFVVNVVRIKSMDSSVLSTKVNIESYEAGDGDPVYNLIYYYEVEGKEYKCDYNNKVNKNPGEKNVTVYYNSKQPSKCMTEYSNVYTYELLLLLIAPLIFIFLPLKNLIKFNKRIKLISELNQKGKLVKKLPYRLETTGRHVKRTKKTIQRPVIDYVLSSGITVNLYGDEIELYGDEERIDAKEFSDNVKCRQDGFADLLIDENNPKNYYIDIEHPINRKSGNLPHDYFQPDYQNNINDLNSHQK